MAFIIDKSEKVSVGTDAVSVPVRCRTFLITNAGNGTIYFRDASDGVACNADNGFPLASGQLLPVTLNADELSVVASAVGADVRLLYGRED